MTALIGTIQYMAPEMLTSAAAGRVEYSAAVDVFSMGIILWQLVTCEAPYADVLATHNRFQLLQRIARDGLRPVVPAHAPPALAQLMAECWDEAEHRRPPSSDLVRRLRMLYFELLGTEFVTGRHSGSSSSATRAADAPMRMTGSSPALVHRDSFPETESEAAPPPRMADPNGSLS